MLHLGEQRPCPRDGSSDKAVGLAAAAARLRGTLKSGRVCVRVDGHQVKPIDPFDPTWRPATGIAQALALPSPTFLWKCPAIEPLAQVRDGLIGRMQVQIVCCALVAHQGRRCSKPVGLARRRLSQRSCTTSKKPPLCVVGGWGGPRDASQITSKDPLGPTVAGVDTMISFESRFESGNLRRAIQVYVVARCRGW